MTLRPPGPGATAPLTDLTTPEQAEALLEAMAGGLFPKGFQGLERLTWRESRGPAESPAESTPEERLLAAEARFRTLVEQIPAVTFMAVLGEGTNEVYVSPHIEAMLGFSQAEWLENPFLWYYQLHPDDRKLWNEEFTRGCQTGGPFRAECRFISRAGEVVWVHGEARLVKDDLGRPQFLQGVAFDITENKRAQHLLLTEAVRTAKIEEELAIARRVQTSILPRTFDVSGLEIAAAMLPAEDVGGDYYDVFRAQGGAWLAIGDVSGHGLNAGLVMLMVQSAVASITATRPDATPAALITLLNGILFDAISSRLESNAYVTLVLVRYWDDGRIAFAGAHEHILVCRKETGLVERIVTPGPWLGIRRNVADAVEESTVALCDGDLLVLFTDGIIEAMNSDGWQFDMQRLCEIVERHRFESPDAIQRHIIAAVQSWMVTLDDDLSVLVARYRRGASQAT
jgi:PAS domain S-box-containing protein